MAENYTLYEKAAIFDRIHSYFTDPIGRDDSRVEQELKEVRVENAKLRELARRFAEYASQERCDGCAFKSRCNDGLLDECCQMAEIRSLARKLGIEVY